MAQGYTGTLGGAAEECILIIPITYYELVYSWKDFYATELDNFEEYGDHGEIWFGKKNIERIVKWLLCKNIDSKASVLDVGCGNGMTLVSLARAGFQNLSGVDYAEEAIALAKNVSQANGVEMRLSAVDFLEHRFVEMYHIIIDKGTYDAICLDIENAPKKRNMYIDQVLKILDNDGYFMIFSCNFTKEELQEHFKDFYQEDEIPIPSIGFGGKTGQTVTAIVLKKKLTG